MVVGIAVYTRQDRKCREHRQFNCTLPSSGYPNCNIWPGYPISDSNTWPGYLSSDSNTWPGYPSESNIWPGYIGNMGCFPEHAWGSFVHYNKDNSTQHTAGVSGAAMLTL